VTRVFHFRCWYGRWRWIKNHSETMSRKLTSTLVSEIGFTNNRCVSVTLLYFYGKNDLALFTQSRQFFSFFRVMGIRKRPFWSRFEMYVRPRYAHKSFYLSQKRYLTQMHGSHKIFEARAFLRFRLFGSLNLACKDNSVLMTQTSLHPL
jgi:hypothetical protein